MRSRLTIVPVLALLGGLSAWAQAPQKFAIINMQEALISTKDGQKAVAALKAKFAPKEQEFQKRQADLQAKQDELRRTENTISEEKKAALARDIDSMTKSLQRDTDDAREDVNQEQQKILNDLGAKVMAVLNKYAVDKQLHHGLRHQRAAEQRDVRDEQHRHHAGHHLALRREPSADSDLIVIFGPAESSSRCAQGACGLQRRRQGLPRRNNFGATLKPREVAR